MAVGTPQIREQRTFASDTDSSLPTTGPRGRVGQRSRTWARAVSSVKDDCPGGLCPVARRSDVESLQSRANTTEALSIGFVAAAAVTTGVGLYLALSTPSAPTAPSAILAPGAAGAPAGLSLLGRF